MKVLNSKIIEVYVIKKQIEKEGARWLGIEMSLITNGLAWCNDYSVFWVISNNNEKNSKDYWKLRNVHQIQ